MSTGSLTASLTCATAAPTRLSQRPRPRIGGPRTWTRWRPPRCTPGRTPGTSGLTSRASRGHSASTWVAAAPTGTSAGGSLPRDTAGSGSAGRTPRAALPHPRRAERRGELAEEPVRSHMPAICRVLSMCSTRGGSVTGRVVVTGGAGCIGLAICRRLADRGWSAIAADLGQAVAQVRWEDLGDSVSAVVLDVRDRKSVDQAAGIVAGSGPITGLVNCAGILRDTFIGQLSGEMMTAMFETNLAGMARVTDAFADSIEDGGAIVNIGSITGHTGRFVGASVYGGTKAAVAAYTSYL